MTEAGILQYTEIKSCIQILICPMSGTFKNHTQQEGGRRRVTGWRVVWIHARVALRRFDSHDATVLSENVVVIVALDISKQSRRS